MTKEEAQQVLDDVACPCDGLGVMPGPRGVAVPCTRCSGTFRSNEELKEARRMLAEMLAAEPCVCGCVSKSGRYGEPLACAHPKGHDGPHAWASLPTFVAGEPQGWIDPLRPGRRL